MKPTSIIILQSLKLLNDYHKNQISFQEHTFDTSTSYQSHIFQTLTSDQPQITSVMAYTLQLIDSFHKLQFLDLKRIHLYLDSFVNLEPLFR